MSKYKLIADTSYKKEQSQLWAIIEGTVSLTQC